MFDGISNADTAEQYMHSTAMLQQELKQSQKYNLMGSKMPIQFVPNLDDSTGKIKPQGQWV